MAKKKTDDEEGAMYVSIFAGAGTDEGLVGLALFGVPLAEVEGLIVPAVSMSPEQAMQIAKHLLDVAKEVLAK